MANEKRLIPLRKRIVYAGDVFNSLMAEKGWSATEASDFVKEFRMVDAVEVEKYKALVEMYHDLRENFIDYVCSGTCNVAPYCLNRCEGCVDRVGWCSQGSDECHGFNPAEVILDDAKMDGDGNA